MLNIPNLVGVKNILVGGEGCSLERNVSIWVQSVIIMWLYTSLIWAQVALLWWAFQAKWEKVSAQFESLLFSKFTGCLPVNLVIYSKMTIKTILYLDLELEISSKCNNIMSRCPRQSADTEQLWSYQITSKHCLVTWRESSSCLFVCLQLNYGFHNVISVFYCNTVQSFIGWFAVLV